MKIDGYKAVYQWYNKEGKRFIGHETILEPCKGKAQTIAKKKADRLNALVIALIPFNWNEWLEQFGKKA